MDLSTFCGTSKQYITSVENVENGTNVAVIYHFVALMYQYCHPYPLVHVILHDNTAIVAIYV